MKPYLVKYTNKADRKKEYVKNFTSNSQIEKFYYRKEKEGCRNIKIERIRHSEYDRSLEREILSKKREYFKSVCIYALINNDEVVYIGQSSDIMGRLASHNSSSKIFTHFAIVERIDTIDSEYVNKREKEYIERLKPRYNKVFI